MPTSRLAAQVESIDPERLTLSPEDATALLGMTKAMTTKRLALKVNKETTEDAAQVAALLACHLLPEFPEDQPDRLTAAAALATYRACLAALEDQGTTKEDAADVLATDPDGLPLLRLALPSSPSPDRLTRTTDTDRLADALSTLADEDPTAAQVLAYATYLPTEDGRTWRDGSPSARPLADLLGMTERQRKSLAKALPAMLDHLTEAMTATLHRHATRTKRGADEDRWTLHRAARQDCQPADPTARQYGRPLTIPRSGPASVVLHHMREGDTYLQVSPDPAVPLLPLPADLPASTLLAQVDTFPAYGRTSADRTGDGWAAAQEPLGAVKKANTAKRKRDGAVGSPMTTGSTRARY